MQPFTHLHESLVKSWNINRTFRSCVQLLSCPFCCGCCCFFFSIRLNDCTGAHARRRRQKRNLVVSEIAQARRERGLASRKRGISVDGRRLGGGVWRKRSTGEQAQSVLFERLPREVREIVWGHVLAPEGEVAVENFLWDGGFERVGNGRTATFGSRDQKEDALRCKAKKGCNTSVLRTCRKVYKEAVDILYSGNNLIFSSYKPLVAFARSIPAPRLEHIKRITIANIPSTDGFHSPFDLGQTYQRYMYEDFFALLSRMSRLKFVNLKYIIIASEQTYNGHYDIGWEQLELLDLWEKRTETLGCEVWYEITGDTDVLESCWNGEEGPGRKLHGRWVVGEKVKIGTSK